MAAVGLRLSDLFDKPLTHHGKPLRPAQRRRYGQAMDALKSIRHESLIVLIAADRLAAGYGIGPEDMERLHTAHGRILNAAKLAGGAS